MGDKRYPFPWGLAWRLGLSILLGKKRSIGEDGQRALAYLSRPLRIAGNCHIPQRGPALITCNHFTRPGLPAWWIVLAISPQFQEPVHWVMTSSWRFDHHPLRKLLEPVSRRLFQRVGRTYGFTSMPAMPPEPDQAAERAWAVRRVLRYVKGAHLPVVGLAPEGRDGASSILQTPPPGLGRFVIHLAQLGLPALPVGIFEEGEALCLQFGAPYSLTPPPDLPPEAADVWGSRTVMNAIAALLPENLRGEWAIPHSTPRSPMGAVHETIEPC
jgi:hypothetical protein